MEEAQWPIKSDADLRGIDADVAKLFFEQDGEKKVVHAQQIAKVAGKDEYVVKRVSNVRRALQPGYDLVKWGAGYILVEPGVLPSDVKAEQSTEMPEAKAVAVVSQKLQARIDEIDAEAAEVGEQIKELQKRLEELKAVRSDIECGMIGIMHVFDK